MNRQEIYEQAQERLGELAGWLSANMKPLGDGRDSLTVIIATIATLGAVLAGSAELQSSFLLTMNLFWDMAESENKEDYRWC